MTEESIAYLMYHELQLAEDDLRQREPSDIRYTVRVAEFRGQLECLRAAGLSGMSVTEALNPSCAGRPSVAITFDDGSETDLLAAAPLLKEAGFNATFYVVTSFLGRRGHLTPAQLRELSDTGFEIGSHSATHCHLDSIGRDRLRAELAGSKERLEDLIGRRVDHFACPFGRWTSLVARMAQGAGYHSVATSRIGTNSPTTNRFRLARVAVLRWTSLPDFKRICCGKGLFPRRVRGAIFSLAKQFLGNSAYEKVRSAILTTADGRMTRKDWLS